MTVTYQTETLDTALEDMKPLLRRLVRDRCDLLLKLPMFGRVQSLNAAVAGSLALYAARRARTPATRL